MEVRQEAGESEAQLADIIQMVRDTVMRRWLLLLVVFAAVTVLGIVAVQFLPVSYTSTAKVRIDPSLNPLATKSADGKAELTPEAIDTEVASVQSPTIARAIVRQFHLERDPEFAKALTGAGAGVGTAADRESTIAKMLLSKLSVSREKLTYILDISFTSADPVKSAKFANAFAQGYIDAKTGNKAGTAERQSQWFERRLKELADDARNADAQVADYRAKAGIVESDGGNANGSTIVDQQITPLAGSLAQAQADAAAARSDLEAARTQMAHGSRDSVGVVLNSATVQALRSQRADIVRNLGEIQVRYGEKHPETLRVRDQLAAVDAQIQSETRRVISALTATAASTQARVESLRQSMAQLESRRAGDTRNAVIAEGLEREATAKRALYDRMSQMALDSMQAARVSLAQAQIVEVAQAPSRPTSPNKPLFYVAALVLGLIAGGATIAVQELMSGTLRSAEDADRTLGLTMLAAIPKVAKGVNPADLLITEPTSFFSESLRIVRAAVLGVRGQAAPKVIALTSALPAEGKSTTALAFARTLAIANAKTLLIECDVRRAVMQRMVKGAPPRVGLVEVIHGDAPLDEAILPGDVPGLDQLLVVSRYFSSEDLFGGGAMENLLNTLRGRYDHIVLDLPPLMGLADGRFLAVLADATIMVVKWDETPASAASSAVNWLRADGSNPVGMVYSMVGQGAESVGGLYYYSRKYAEYYRSA
ncbi:polysaccharide biosynthesis tyrosine autokinase [Sphingomonas sp. H39-1-10]|uniref:GumC family protein n=1 Tax=Sphingomonas pollutisoli TaxID=3030829 RepID=UPI0023B9AFAB|nr:polysaccharide biosynthesis tyrosine autokinase [Sphingomonas pollutisoli]MDF0490648.1 polysaccharide biosynthesis tyrosine autokinase [Sphingomonas pollutisoli]